jgi:hypothetical protein
MEEEKTISPEVAEAEVKKWLDAKKVTSSKREKKKPFINVLIEAVESGRLVLDDNNNWVYTLLFDDVVTVGKLTFKPRINRYDLEQYKLSQADTSDERLLIYTATLTGTSPGILRKLDTEDANLCDAIAVFFT